MLPGGAIIATEGCAPLNTRSLALSYYGLRAHGCSTNAEAGIGEREEVPAPAGGFRERVFAHPPHGDPPVPHRRREIEVPLNRAQVNRA